MLDNWFNPINSNEISNDLPFDNLQLGDHIKMYEDSFPNLSDVHIAIIGTNSQSNIIRSTFYRMQLISEKIVIADLGNLVNTKENTLKVVLDELLSHNILPLILGVNSDNTINYLKAHLSSSDKEHLHPLFIDERIAFGKSVSRSYLNPILESDKKLISELTILSYQMHYSNNGLGEMKEIPLHSLRLGQIKTKITEVEPYIRDTDNMFFMMNALKHAESPAQTKSNPSGLFSEEACQICKYAGLNTNMKFAAFGEYDLSHDNFNQTSEIISQMMWYFIFGYSNRFQENEEDWVKYLINLEEEQENFVFYKSTLSGRWWVSNIDNDESEKRACSYDDYLSSIKNHISDRLLDLFH